MSSPAPNPLSYEPPDPRKRRSRWLSRVALVASAIALLVVARLVFEKFAPVVRARVERIAAQREVLQLARPGRPLDSDFWGTPPLSPPDPEFDHALLRWAKTVWPFRIGQSITMGSKQAIYLGPLQNAGGRDRIISLEIAPSSLWPDARANDDRCVVWEINARPRLGWLEVESRPPAAPVRGILRRGGGVHLDAPTLDPKDPKRLLLTGSAHGASLSYEIVLDASDDPQVFDLRATKATTRVSGPN